jgi:hypothetical protein
MISEQNYIHILQKKPQETLKWVFRAFVGTFFMTLLILVVSNGFQLFFFIFTSTLQVLDYNYYFLPFHLEISDRP